MRMLLGPVALVFAMTPSVEASHIKYTYLKVGQGQGAQVYAFKSKAECEKEKRRHKLFRRKIVAELRKHVKSVGRFDENDGNPRCLNTLPYGYERPKTGH